MSGFNDPDIYVSKQAGIVDKLPNGDLLLHGTGGGPGGDWLSGNTPGKVRISNKGQRWLTFDVYKQINNTVTSDVPRTQTGSVKVNPGKTLEIAAPGQYGNLYDKYLGSVSWSDKDPTPADPGGDTASQIDLKNIEDWFNNNKWVAVALVTLAVIGGVSLAYIVSRIPKVPEAQEV